MWNLRPLLPSALSVCLSFCLAAGALAHTPDDGVSPRPVADHETVPAQGSRFITTRSGHELELPVDEDSFIFAVFGDRTGGPPEGIAVLDQAVADVNLIEPDLVMTVGDMIQGYNQTPEWLTEMREYKQSMDRLAMPWFPVAGNHDVYWRGPDAPEGEHEANYEMHFGPLWYAFEHRDCWFIVIYTDEGDPETGDKSLRGTSQRMSDEQFNWLRETLEKTKDARHVFLFMHHGRWQGFADEALNRSYADSDWERVHQLLVEAGNVTACFAGHIHRMRYDPKDGIEYVTLATVGGHQGGAVPEAGYLHQFHLVTVREDSIALASIPVGEVQDVRAITGKVSEDARNLASVRPVFDQNIVIGSEGTAEGSVRVSIENPTDRPVDVMLTPHSADSRWFFTPDHTHATMPAGGGITMRIDYRRLPDSLDEALRPAEVAIGMSYRGEHMRVNIPEVSTSIPTTLERFPDSALNIDGMAVLDGDDAIAVPSSIASIPDGPFTLECWFNAAEWRRGQAILSKTESSEFGLYVNDRSPQFPVHIGGRYVEPRAEQIKLDENRWYHIAGVYDGSEARLYIDGELVASEPAIGERRTNTLPMMIGADTSNRWGAHRFFNGTIDNVRLSTTARYTDNFRPEHTFNVDEHTALHMTFRGRLGPWFYATPAGIEYPTAIGDPSIDPAEHRTEPPASAGVD